MPALVPDSQIDDFRSRLVGSVHGVVRLLALESSREFTPDGEVIRFVLTLSAPPPELDTWPVLDINEVIAEINHAASDAGISEKFTVTFTNDE